MKVTDKVYVVDWGKHYGDITRWNSKSEKREPIFPITTPIPDYSGIDFHWKYNYEPNLTKKGTVNKREPRKLVSKEPAYKNYKWEILEIFKHPKAGEYWYDEEEAKAKGWTNNKYTENDLLLLASTHTDKEWMKCYIIIDEKGVSELTPEQYENEKFNAFINANLGKWDRNDMNRKNVPKEIISVFYDLNDNVLFGSDMTKGLVTYSYLESKFSIDNKPIYLHCSISYDGKGNANCPDKTLIRSFEYIKDFLEN